MVASMLGGLQSPATSLGWDQLPSWQGLLLWEASHAHELQLPSPPHLFAVTVTFAAVVAVTFATALLEVGADARDSACAAPALSEAAGYFVVESAMQPWLVNPAALISPVPTSAPTTTDSSTRSAPPGSLDAPRSVDLVLPPVGSAASLVHRY
jgi:hypothetical protein